jgi:hypothetical protein
VDKAKGFLSRLTLKAATKLFKNSWDEFQEAVEANGSEEQVLSFINKGFKTNYRTMDQIGNAKPKPTRLGESDDVNESTKHWWDLVKTEAFPTLAFYPALSIWLEIDQLMKGNDMDLKKVTIYALFWVLLVSGKYVKGWMDWKKQNPEEYKAERLQGKGGIV